MRAQSNNLGKESGSVEQVNCLLVVSACLYFCDACVVFWRRQSSMNLQSAGMETNTSLL